MPKTKVAIIGSGNIGTDLMMKLRDSKDLELTAMIGIDPDSDGLKRAQELGIEAFDNGIEGFMEQPELADILFDATSAKAHIHHAKLLKEAGKKVIDLTPAAAGPFVVPPVNLGAHLDQDNVNMITCGGQATIPMIHAVSRVASVSYAEIVATISSRSAGPGTRANIDEFTKTTKRGIEEIGGAKEGKAIIILNPADPPIMMRDTVYVLTEEEIDNLDDINASIQEMVQTVQSYVPGYQLRAEPIFDGNQITIFIEVEGAGAYLPKYAGNLDIMTAAAVRVGEVMANHLNVKAF